MQRDTQTYIYIALVGALAIALCYVTLTASAAQRKSLTQIQAQRGAFSVASILSYGTVESIDLQNRTVTARFLSPFSPYETRVLKFRVTENALIAQQNLLGKDGEYSSLTKRTPATLSQVTEGTRIAALIWGSGTKIESGLLLFGNPL